MYAITNGIFEINNLYQGKQGNSTNMILAAIWGFWFLNFPNIELTYIILVLFN